VLVSLVALNTFLLDCKEVDKAGIFVCVTNVCL
jgi:hypothetical protein